MSDIKLRDAMNNWGAALTRLEEAIAKPDEGMEKRDITILRFLLVYELSWKTLKRFLAYVEIEVRNPRDTMKYAFQQQWIDDEDLWLSMAENRNLVAHTYDEKRAIQVYEDICTFAPEIRKSYELLREKFSGILVKG